MVYPENPVMRDRARRLRYNSTPPEKLLWFALRGRRICGLKFRRQEIVGQYVVDFCCREKKLIVEVDGTSHEEKSLADQQRTDWLAEEGYRVIRVTNQEVSDDLESVVRYIAQQAGLTLE